MSLIPENIAIYSVGLLGGSIGLALKNSGFKGKIMGLSSPENIRIAQDLGCIDEGYSYEKLQDVVSDCNLIFLCSPINSIIKSIETLGKLKLHDNLIITDVGSTKNAIVSAAIKALPSNIHFIGGHPMTGSEKSGPSASDPYLFQNAIYVITPQNGEPDSLHKEFALFLEKYLGCRTLFLNPSIHDRIAATVSHLPHILAVTLVNLAQSVESQIPGTLTLAAGGFRDMTRIASAPYSMWHDILSTNKTAVEPLIDSFINLLSEIKLQLKNDSLSDAFNQSRQTRSRIPSSNKGFIHTLSEILVIAKDQPGFIASLTRTLAEKNINIKDIEVMKVREGEGGTIRLAFESPVIASEAVSVLIKNGFSARERT